MFVQKDLPQSFATCCRNKRRFFYFLVLPVGRAQHSSTPFAFRSSVSSAQKLNQSSVTISLSKVLNTLGVKFNVTGTARCVVLRCWVIGRQGLYLALDCHQLSTLSGLRTQLDPILRSELKRINWNLKKYTFSEHQPLYWAHASQSLRFSRKCDLYNLDVLRRRIQNKDWLESLTIGVFNKRKNVTMNAHSERQL